MIYKAMEIKCDLALSSTTGGIVLRFCFFLLSTVCFGFNSRAQSKEELAYKEQSAKIRADVWKSGSAEFSNYEIPATYQGASKVVIAHHTDLSADSKSKFNFMMGKVKQQSITEVTREIIKVNDKVAVDEYSSLSFTKLSKGKTYRSTSVSTTYVGIRIIKPNHVIKEINADDILMVKDEKLEKEAKVAIPNLEVGDIVDYFIMTEQDLVNTFTEKNYTIALFDDAPILHYSFHGEIGKKYALSYRSYNDAPELKVTRNGYDETVMDLEKKNIAPFETSLWISAAKQLPVVRIKIGLGSKGAEKAGGSAAGEVERNKSLDDILVQAANQTQGEAANIQSALMGDYIKTNAERFAKQTGKAFKDMADADKASLLFYSHRFMNYLSFDINNLKELIAIGNYTFKENSEILNMAFGFADLQPSILLATPKFGFRLKEAFDRDDLVKAVYLSSIKKIYKFENIYDNPQSVPEELDGVKDTKSLTYRKHNPKYVPAAPGPSIPESKATDNGHIENLVISVAPDQNNLVVKRRTIAKGFYKRSLQRSLILYEDFYEAERLALGEKESLIEILEGSKKTRKSVDEVKSAFEEARKEQKKNFVEDAKDYLEQEITDLKDQKIENMGTRHTAPDFIYSSNFRMNGLLKKAGNNLIFEIGKIQGSPLAIKPEQRKRELDIYMSFPRSIEYWMEINIPEGYTAQGVTELNKNVSNETGFFTVEASSDNKIIHVKVKKHYLHGFEKTSEWSKITSFVDASNDWVNAKILFKKN